jgi:hypothetical protein
MQYANGSIMTYSYTGDSVNVCITVVGSFLPTTSVGSGITAVGKAGRVFTDKGLLCLNAAAPAGSVTERGWAQTPNLALCVTKAAVSAADRVLDDGRAFTLADEPVRANSSPSRRVGSSGCPIRRTGP